MSAFVGPRSERVVALAFIGLSVLSAAWLLALVEEAEWRRDDRVRQLSYLNRLRTPASVQVRGSGPIRELDGLFGDHGVGWVRSEFGYALQLLPVPAPELRG